MLGSDMSIDCEPLPSDLVTAHAMILAERAARLEAEARARNAEAEVSGVRLEIERLRLLLARMRRERFGQSSERGARLIEQLELQLAELEEGVAEEEAAAEIAAPPPERTERSSHARKPARRPLPETPAARAHRLPGALHLPQVRRPGPQAGRGRDRDPGVRAAALEGGRARAGEGHLPLAARRSASRRPPRIRSPVAGPVPTCWPWCWRPSTGSTCR